MTKFASVLAKEDVPDPAPRSHAEIVAAAFISRVASPDSTDPDDFDLLELTEAERRALPAGFHRPMWYALATPAAWLCAVCWGDGTASQWPCEPAIAGGPELARELGLNSVT